MRKSVFALLSLLALGLTVQAAPSSRPRPAATQSAAEFSADSDAQDCLERFSKDLSDRMLFTNTPNMETRPAILSSVWSNQTLTPKNLGEREDRQLVLEQLSYPLYFAQNPRALRSMIARNHEAVAAYANYVLGIGHNGTIPNPEVLADRLSAYLSAAKVHRKFHAAEARPLTDQLIKRVNDVENELNGTLGDKQVMEHLWSGMEQDLNGYEGTAKSVLSDLMKFDYKEDRARLNDKGVLKGCSKGWPDLQVPRDAKSGLATDTFVPQIFWIGQEMGLGRLGQCYEAGQVKSSRVTFGLEPNYYQVYFQIKVYFNPLPGMTDSKITAAELPKTATEFTKHSLPVAMKSLSTKHHYTTFFGSTVDVYSRAWYATALDLNDIFECGQPGQFSTSANTACVLDPKRYIPVNQFIADSVSQLSADDARKTEETLKRAVQSVLNHVLKNRSDIWNASTLSYEDSNPGKVLSDRAVMKQTILADALKPYTRKYLLAKNLLLTSFYHENQMALCLARLDLYSPKRVVEAVGAKIMEQGVSIGSEFHRRIIDTMAECQGHVLHPQLRTLRSQLQQMLAADKENKRMRFLQRLGLRPN